MKPQAAVTTKIQVIYPKPGHVVYEDSTFLMGNVQGLPPLGTLTIGGQPVPISPHGFFSWKVPVHAGNNAIHLACQAPASSVPLTEQTLTVYGEPPLAILPTLPLAVHAETLTPSQDLWLTASDSLIVACAASEGVSVSITIPGLTKKPIPIPPLVSDPPYVDTREGIFAHLHWTAQRIPVRGYYRAAIPLASLLNAQEQPGNTSSLANLPIILHLDHLGKSWQQTLPGRLTVLSQPKAAVVKQDRAVTRTAPESGARLTRQPADTRLCIDGLDRGWARARLTPDTSFWVSSDDLVFLPSVPVAAPASLAFVKTAPLNAWESRVHLAFAHHPAADCPVLIEALPTDRNNRLQVRLYNVCSRCDFMHYPPNEAVIRQIHWRSIAENAIELWIDLHRPLAGYDYSLRGEEWQLTVKSLPPTVAETCVLIDPGHGGNESGSVGLNGLPEKNLNLTVAKLLESALKAEGFQVSMTRQTDVDVSLQARGQATVGVKADIVLSVHHNALPDGRDPLKERGVCTFYYHAFAKPLADLLLLSLTAESSEWMHPLPSYGVFYDSLYMTRIHQATAVLVELGFFTDPDDFEYLIQPKFQTAEVQRLAKALTAYCQQHSQPQSS